MTVLNGWHYEKEPFEITLLKSIFWHHISRSFFLENTHAFVQSQQGISCHIPTFILKTASSVFAVVTVLRHNR